MIKKIFISFSSLTYLSSIFALNFMGCSSLIGRKASVSSNQFDSDKPTELLVPLNEIFLNQRKLATASEIEDTVVEMNERSVQWWKDYRIAMVTKNKDRTKSCDLFLALSKENDFPLKDLALMRSIQFCSDETLPLPATYPFYLKTLYLDLRLKKALKAESSLKKPSELLATYETLFENESNSQKKKIGLSLPSI